MENKKAFDKSKLSAEFMPQSALIMESDETLQRLITGYLKNLKVKQVDFFTEGVKAIEAIERNSYDLIMLDWRHKNPPGQEVFEYIRQDERTKYTPLILISGFLTKDDLSMVAEHPNTNFLVKPFTEEILLGVLTRVCKSAYENFGAQLLEQKQIYLPPIESLDGSDMDIRKPLQKYLAAENSAIQAEAGRKDHTWAQKPAQASYADFGIGVEKPKETPDWQIGLDGKKPGQEKPGDLSVSNMMDFIDPDMDLLNLNMDDFAPISPKKTDGSKLDYEQKAKKDLIGSQISYGKSNAVPLEEITNEKVTSALVVDSDPSVCKIIENYLKQLKVKDIQVRNDGKEAWELLKVKPYDLVILDWRMKSLTGISLYNRIRSYKTLKNTLVVILCGFSKKEDFRILEGNPTTAFLEKPFQLEVLDEKVQGLCRYREKHTDIRVFVDELTRAIMMGQFENADVQKAIQDRYPDNLEVPISASESLIAKHMYQAAEELLLAVHQKAPYNVRILGNLGKVYHYLNQPGKAFTILRKANFLSPQNIERLCMLGEVGLTLQEPMKARVYFKKILSIDEEHPTGKAGLVVADNMSDHLAKHNFSRPLNLKFSSILNVIGITYVRNREFARGIDQYIAAMSFINDDSILSKLQFNLGLAYLRSRQFDQAKNWFNSALLLADTEFRKPKLFLDKLDTFRRSSDAELSDLSLEAFEFDAA